MFSLASAASKSMEAEVRAKMEQDRRKQKLRTTTDRREPSRQGSSGSFNKRPTKTLAKSTSPDASQRRRAYANIRGRELGLGPEPEPVMLQRGMTASCDSHLKAPGMHRRSSIDPTFGTATSRNSSVDSNQRGRRRPFFSRTASQPRLSSTRGIDESSPGRPSPSGSPSTLVTESDKDDEAPLSASPSPDHRRTESYDSNITHTRSSKSPVIRVQRRSSAGANSRSISSEDSDNPRGSRRRSFFARPACQSRLLSTSSIDESAPDSSSPSRLAAEPDQTELILAELVDRREHFRSVMDKRSTSMDKRSTSASQQNLMVKSSASDHDVNSVVSDATSARSVSIATSTDSDLSCSVMDLSIGTELDAPRTVFTRRGSFMSNISSNSSHHARISNKYRLNLNNGKLYGRDSDINQVKNFFRRTSIGSVEVLFVEGLSGTGKTALVEKALLSEDCIFAQGTFEKGNAQQPFAALIAVFAELIDEILEDDELHEDIADEFSINDAEALTRFMPQFRDVFDEADDGESGSGNTAPSWSDRTDALNRTKASLREFLRVLTREAISPIIICLDDLQWADATAMSLIEYLAHDPLQQNFMFVGVYRQNEIGELHPLNSLKEKLQDGRASTTTIMLNGLSIIDVNKLLAQATSLDEGTTFPLATLVMTRTNGNAFFVIQLLEHLQTERLLYYNFKTYRWTWDLEKVRGTALSEHVVDLVTNRIQGHPQYAQRILKLAACVGFKVDICVLEAIKDALPDGGPLDINCALEFCIQERLLVRLADGRVKFFHDKIHQATMSLLPDGDEFEILHLRIGVMLWTYINSLSRAGQKVDDTLIFLCSDQLSLGAEHIKESHMKLKVAQLNNMVGKKATELSAFATAADYYEKGIELLHDLPNKWYEHHDLCISLHVAYAEVQYYMGQFESSMDAIKDVLDHDPSSNAKIRVSQTRLHILKSEGRLKEYVDSARKFLNELGEGHLDHREHVVKNLKDLSDDDILNLPRLKDGRKAIALKILNSMIVPLQTLGMKSLSSHVIIRALNICVRDGVSLLSPETLALYGVYLIAEKGALAEGYRFGELALNLSQKLDPNAMDPRVAQWVHLCTKPWQLVPLAQCVDHMFAGHVAAMEQGVPFCAFNSVNGYFALSFFSSLDLRPLLRDMEGFSTQMLDYGQKIAFLQILPIWQTVMNLTGKSDDPMNIMQGDAIDKQHDLGNPNRVGEHASWSYQMQLSFYMGDMDVACEMSRKLQAVKLGLAKADCSYPAQVFFFGLIAVMNARKTGKRKYKLEASKHILTLREWAKQRAANVAPKMMIVEAEYETLETKDSEALRHKYDVAILTARKGGFIQDAALAAYLAGKMLLKTKDAIHYSDTYIIKSYELFKSWGAIAVSKRIKDDHEMIFCAESVSFTERGNFLSRERFDRRVSLHHERRLAEY